MRKLALLVLLSGCAGPVGEADGGTGCTVEDCRSGVEDCEELGGGPGYLCEDGQEAEGEPTAEGARSYWACESAQAALNSAFVSCGYESGPDLECSQYAYRNADCSDYFKGVEDSAGCDGDQVVWSFGDAC